MGIKGFEAPEQRGRGQESSDVVLVRMSLPGCMNRLLFMAASWESRRNPFPKAVEHCVICSHKLAQLRFHVQSGNQMPDVLNGHAILLIQILSASNQLSLGISFDLS